MRLVAMRDSAINGNAAHAKSGNVRHVMFARGLPAYYFLTPGQASLRNFGKIRC